MIQIEESNPSFESCHKCIHSDDSEETCILRQCIHAVAQLKECYVPKQRKKGKWINVRHDNIAECDQCGITGRAWMNFCFDCGADMAEGEG